MQQEPSDAVAATRWTEAEVTDFRQALATFRDGLPPRQREAFDELLATAHAATGGQEVRGYLFSAVLPLAATAVQPVAPRDAATGQATGRRMYQPIP